jgi:hypothetical protein
LAGGGNKNVHFWGTIMSKIGEQRKRYSDKKIYGLRGLKGWKCFCGFN